MKVAKMMLSMVLALCALAAYVLALAACGDATQREWSEQDGLRIALLVDDGNPQSIAVFEDFRARLSAYIGMPVQIIEGVTHRVGIEAMRAGNLDVMWGSPFVYLLAREAVDVERLVVTDNPASVNKTVFITAREGVYSLEDLRGLDFAFISASSTSGFFYPVYHLMNEFDLSRDQVLAGGFFNSVATSGSQNNSIMGVVRGDYDAAAVGNLNLQNIIASGLIREDEVRIIGSTEVIPFPGYIAAGHLPAQLIAQIRAFMLAYDNEEYFGVRFGTPDTRFVLPDDASLQHLISMSEVLEIDLAGQ